MLIKPNEAVVTGREGGVRMQRRFGSSFKLRIDVSLSRYAYEELPYHIASRYHLLTGFYFISIGLTKQLGFNQHINMFEMQLLQTSRTAIAHHSFKA